MGDGWMEALADGFGEHVCMVSEEEYLEIDASYSIQLNLSSYLSLT